MMTLLAMALMKLKTMTNSPTNTDDDPQCSCGAFLDERDFAAGRCSDCQRKQARQERQTVEAELGIRDESLVKVS